MQDYIGKTAQFAKTIAESDIYNFAGITGDMNPVHINEEYAKTTKFGGRIAHGMLTASFICTVLGMYLPGVGTIHVRQELDFLRPVYIGDTVTVRLEVVALIENKPFLKIRSQVFNQRNELVVDGYSIVKPPKTI